MMSLADQKNARRAVLKVPAPKSVHELCQLGA